MEKSREEMLEVVRDGQRVGLFYTMEEAEKLAARVVLVFPGASVEIWSAAVELSSDGVLNVNRVSIVEKMGRVNR